MLRHRSLAKQPEFRVREESAVINTDRANIYIAVVATAALASLGVWVFAEWLPGQRASVGWPGLACALVLAIATVLSRRVPMKFGRTDVDLVDAVVLIAVVLAGPLWALAVVAPASIYRPMIRTVYVASCDILRIVVAGAVLSYFSAPLLAGAEVNTALINGVLLSGLCFFAVDVFINLFFLRVKYARALKETLLEDFLPLMPANFGALGTVVVTVLIFSSFGAAAALTLGCGAVAVFTSAHLIHERQSRAEAAEQRVSELEVELEQSGRYLPEAMIELLGRKDGYTDRHAAASAVYARGIALQMGIENERAELVGRAALLQDIGLLAVPEEVLNTPYHKLNPLGRRSLEHHPIDTERLLSRQPGFTEAATWLRWHHEREDGSGYPDRLRGQWLPLEAKIISVASFYSSMVLDQPGQRGLEPSQARTELLKSIDGKLDPAVVKPFISLLDTEDENYAIARDYRFRPANHEPPTASSGAS